MSLSLLAKELYSQFYDNYRKTFYAVLTHAALLDRAFAYCPRFLTAGSDLRPRPSPNVAVYPLRPTKDYGKGI